MDPGVEVSSKNAKRKGVSMSKNDIIQGELRDINTTLHKLSRDLFVLHIVIGTRHIIHLPGPIAIVTIQPSPRRRCTTCPFTL